MRRYLFVLFTFSIVNVFASGSETAKRDWELRKNENNIKVYTREVVGSQYLEFKSEAYFSCSVSTFVAILQDASSSTEWSYGCGECKVLKQPSETDQYQYAIGDAPWPVTDRDMVIHQVFTKMKDNSVKVVLSSAHDMVAPRPEYLRVKKFSGFWYIQPIDAQRIKVTYQLHAEPSGSIPAWLANSLVIDNPYNSLLKLNDLVTEKRFVSKSFQFLK